MKHFNAHNCVDFLFGLNRLATLMKLELIINSILVLTVSIYLFGLEVTLTQIKFEIVVNGLSVCRHPRQTHPWGFAHLVLARICPASVLTLGIDVADHWIDHRCQINHKDDTSQRR